MQHEQPANDEQHDEQPAIDEQHEQPVIDEQHEHPKDQLLSDDDELVSDDDDDKTVEVASQEFKPTQPTIMPPWYLLLLLLKGSHREDRLKWVSNCYPFLSRAEKIHVSKVTMHMGLGLIARCIELDYLDRKIKKMQLKLGHDQATYDRKKRNLIINYQPIREPEPIVRKKRILNLIEPIR